MDEPMQGNATPNDSADAPIRTTLTFDPRDLIPTPIFCATPDGRMVWMNAAAEALTGLEPKDLAGTSFAEFFPAHQRRSIARKFLGQHRTGQRDFYVEAPVTDRFGAPHWVGMHVRLVTASNGRSAYLCSAHDLQDIHCELENHRLRERELEARLSEATAGAELKSAFLANMSHELRAPMNGVIGMSRLLLDTGLDRDQHTFAEVIRASGEQLLELVDDILDYSRIESGQLEIGRMDFDLRVTVDAVASLLADRAQEAGVTFTSWVHHRVPSRLVGDPGRVRQVLLDVCQQALKVAPAGEMGLRVELFEETAHQVVVRFQVNRTIPQAPDEEDPLATFQVFGAAGVGPAGDGGSGARALGLSIDRKVVQLMGGDSGVVPVPGVGARLWFRVPFGKQAEVELPVEPTGPGVAFSGLRVLVADPSAAFRQTVVKTFTGWGALCDEAESGLDALERLNTGAAGGRPYALVVANIDLPEMDSGTLGRSVRADEALARTGLVLVTDTGRPGDAARATEWGFDAYFVKPLEDDALRAAVEQVVGRAAADERPLVTRFTLAERRRSRVRVLLIEGNPIDQLVALSALKRVGYSAEAAAGATEAAEAVARQAADIVFFDPSVGGFDTPEAIQGLRTQDAPGHRTPIVALTGRMRDEEHEHWRTLGVDDFLPKPIDLELLCATVEKWWREPAVAAPASSEPAVAAPASIEPAVAATVAEPAAEPAPAPAPAPEVTEPPSAQDEFESMPLVDATRIESSSMGNPELRSMLVEAFLARTAQPLERLRIAHESGDRKQMEIQAHALRGLCVTLGATRAAALFDRIEHHAANEPKASLDAWVRRGSDAIRAAMVAVVPRERANDDAATDAGAGATATSGEESRAA
jgi:PAS domain S-box-containing protein